MKEHCVGEQILDRLDTPCFYIRQNTFRPFIYGLIDPLTPLHIRYVGMAYVNSDRPFSHSKRAKKNQDNSSHLLTWIKSLQRENREYSVLILEELSEDASRKFTGEIEKSYIKSLREIGHDLTNATKGGDGFSGKHTLESRAKLSVSLKAHIRTDEHCKNISLGKKGKEGHGQTDETREKIGNTLKGHNVTEETRNNLSNALKGHEVSVECRTSISDTLKDYYSVPENRLKRSISAKESSSKLEWRLKQRNAHLGKKSSEATRKAQSDALKGRIFTDDHKVALKLAWEERKRKNDALTPQQKLKKELERAERCLAALRAEKDRT